MKIDRAYAAVDRGAYTLISDDPVVVDRVEKILRAATRPSRERPGNGRGSAIRPDADSPAGEEEGR